MAWHVGCSSERQMITRRLLLVMALLASSLLSNEARARETDGAAPAEPHPVDSEPASVWDRQLSFYGQVAPTGSPVGFLGASVDYAPIPILSFELGVGVGAGSPPRDFGAQAALLAHLKPIRNDHWALTVGAGPSVGNYGTTVWTVDQTDGALRYRPAVWANGEVGVEARFNSGFSWRSALGVSRMLNPGSGQCPTDYCYTSGQNPTTLLYLSLGLGFAVL